MSNRALVFEDNPVSSKLMSMFLSQSGYFVELALSTIELEQKISQGFDVVFVDTASPALGKEALEDFVRAAKSSQMYNCPPLVAVLTTTKETEIKRYMSIGMDGYIIKPISVKSLKDTLDRVRSGKTSPAPGEDVVDIEKLAQTLGIPNIPVVLDLFDKFFQTVRKELDDMRNAVALKDFAAIRSLAHSIKGSSRNLRLNNIGKLAEDIESQAKYPSQTLDLNSLINGLESALSRVFNDFNTKYHNK
jgi:CheY-like chemotaxis protein